ncbi:DUF6046 domain-containing protein [Chryseobacterium salviniae]|uniref:DUF6046 domain-containing protein n=1 Tax=Chryseobacterium salviniae TaxID=3101750 RepID=A0ABU6HU33_9FLAO|nr:DUF6046 domain-containing protein [Chryseobacterium sp. T9W2-O]MEC3875933.1 DUF6046 domain-containing protein [Chryseobacterium sp. T9W2-O]
MEFTFKELVAKAHLDYVGPAFPSWWGKNKTKFVLPSLKNVARDLLLGGRYFQQISFSYKGETFDLPNEPLISMSLQKTIVETATVGTERIGTVKEYICTEDYQITIRGVCVNDDPDERDVFPSDQVEMIQSMFLINDRLEVVTNPFLELFEIRSVVLKSINWEEMAGEQGLQKYTITAVSDNDFFADMTEKNRLIQS